VAVCIPDDPYSNDDARAVVTDAARNVYVAGCADGALPGQTHKGEFDVFVRKYRPNGSLAWTRQFGTSGFDCATGIAVDKSGRIYVAGYVGGALPGQSHSGQSDGFLRKMRPDGSTIWTRQFGSSSWDYAGAVAIDKAGRIIVSGDTMGALPGKVHRGGADAFLRKFRPAGSTVWTRQYGSSDDDYGQSVAIDKDNRIVVAGYTWATLPGQTGKGMQDAYVRKFRPDGKASWTRQFGTSKDDQSYAVATDAAGRIYVAGDTHGAFPGKTNKGNSDGFLRKFRPDGKTAWTRQFGTNGMDSAQGITTDKFGRSIVSGATKGAFPGQANSGNTDAFIRKFRPDGKTSWTRQFGTGASDHGESVATDAAGRIIIVGSTAGTLPGQTNKGVEDVFVRKYR